MQKIIFYFKKFKNTESAQLRYKIVPKHTVQFGKICDPKSKHDLFSILIK